MYKMKGIILSAVVILTLTSTLIQIVSCNRWREEQPDEGMNSEEYWARMEGESCKCSSNCLDKLETHYTRCYQNHTVYFKCLKSSCTIKFCSANQVFNTETSSCEDCPAGYQKNLAGSHCVCKEGTRFNDLKRICVPCPTDAIVTRENCYCNSSVMRHYVTNACRKCPDDAELYSETCRCKNPRMLWNNIQFQCQECPGELVEAEPDKWTDGQKFFCQCPGRNEIFNRYSSACVDCPPGTKPYIHSVFDQICPCPAYSKYYNPKAHSCLNVYDD